MSINIDAETRLNELRAVIRDEVVQELIRQLSQCEEQLINSRAMIVQLKNEVDALRLDLHFYDNSNKRAYQ
jgi:hypothetical protein